jgi:hypothetical protein
MPSTSKFTNKHLHRTNAQIRTNRCDMIQALETNPCLHGGHETAELTGVFSSSPCCFRLSAMSPKLRPPIRSTSVGIRASDGQSRAARSCAVQTANALPRTAAVSGKPGTAICNAKKWSRTKTMLHDKHVAPAKESVSYSPAASGAANADDTPGTKTVGMPALRNAWSSLATRENTVCEHKHCTQSQPIIMQVKSSHASPSIYCAMHYIVTLLHCPRLSQYDCCLPFPCIYAQTMQHCQHPYTASNFSNLT